MGFIILLYARYFTGVYVGLLVTAAGSDIHSDAKCLHFGGKIR